MNALVQPPVADSWIAAPSLPARAMERISALGEMTGGIAHDFRNLLAVIDSALSLADRHGGDDAKRRRYIDAARESVERGLKLTSRLLTLARPHAVDLRFASPAALIADFLPFLRYGAGARVLVRLEPGQGEAECLIDPFQFQAALLNLVVNARDAMGDEGGEIRIRTDLVRRRRETADPAPSELRVRLSDDGPGMSDKVIAHIFDPWFTTKGQSGTGLGLVQVHGFMAQVGGRVAVSSRPGQGSRFDLFFPVRDPAADEPGLARQVDRWDNEGGAEAKAP